MPYNGSSSDAGYGSGSSYNYSGTQSGQGNWNTGGQPTGQGSFANGIVGNQPRFNVAPTMRPGQDPAQFAQILARYNAQIAQQQGANQGGVRGVAPGAGVNPVMPQVPIPRPKPNILSFLGVPPPVDNNIALREYLSGQPSYARGAPLPYHAYYNPPSNPGPSMIGQGQTVYKNQSFPAYSGPGGLTNNPASPQGHTGGGYGGGGGGGF